MRGGEGAEQLGQTLRPGALRLDEPQHVGDDRLGVVGAEVPFRGVGTPQMVKEGHSAHRRP